MREEQLFDTMLHHLLLLCRSIARIHKSSNSPKRCYTRPVNINGTAVDNGRCATEGRRTAGLWSEPLRLATIILGQRVKQTLRLRVGRAWFVRAGDARMAGGACCGLAPILGG